MRKFGLCACALALLFSTSCSQSFEGESKTEEEPKKDTFQDFGLVVKETGVRAFRDEDFVVSKGVVASKWKSSCRESPKTTDGEHVCTVREFDEYRDQVTFEFMYADASRYSFKQPRVQATGGRAQPQIQDFSNDVDEKTGEITLRHGCSQGAREEREKSQVVMKFLLDEETKLVLTWDKICGYGEHKKLDYGWFAGNGDDMSKAVSLRGQDKSGTMFGPNVLSTRLYLTLETGAHSQYYDTPVVESNSESDGEAVGVELRGSNYGGVIAATSFSVFDVMYSCGTKGRSRVSAIIGVAPFKAVRMWWRKDCGGGAASRVHVGTRAPLWGYAANADVVVGGRAVGAYKRDGNGSDAGRVTQHRERLGKRMFYVWTTRDEGSVGAAEDVGEVSAHAEDERVLSSGARVWREGGVGTRAVGVWTRCKRRGKTRVGVTVTVRDRDAVEWWVEDECTRGRLRGRRGGWKVTAGGLMYATLGLFGLAMVAWMRREVKGAGRRSEWRRRA